MPSKQKYKTKTQHIMKKARFLIPVLAAMLAGLFATSCGPEDVIEGSYVRVAEMTVYRNHWNDDGSGYLWCSFDWPEGITTEVLKYGTVVAYVYDGERQCPLPHVIPITYNVNGTDVVVPENLRFDMEPGIITFIMEDLDGNMPTGINTDLTFRVVSTVPRYYAVE